MIHDPCGGGLRILGIRELFVEDDPFDLVGKLSDLDRIDSRLEAVKQLGEGFVRGVARSSRRVVEGRQLYGLSRLNLIPAFAPKTHCRWILPRHTSIVREQSRFILVQNEREFIVTNQPLASQAVPRLMPRCYDGITEPSRHEMPDL
jgi:hypothetical protein